MMRTETDKLRDEIERQKKVIRDLSQECCHLRATAEGRIIKPAKQEKVDFNDALPRVRRVFIPEQESAFLLNMNYNKQHAARKLSVLVQKRMIAGSLGISIQQLEALPSWKEIYKAIVIFYGQSGGDVLNSNNRRGKSHFSKGELDLAATNCVAFCKRLIELYPKLQEEST